MSVARLSYARLLQAASAVGCAGIEVRNDLHGRLFDGVSAMDAGRQAAQQGLEIFAVAEVKAFNNFSDATLDHAIELMETAVQCKARGVALIPRCDGQGCTDKERTINLQTAVRELKPLLQA